MDQDRIEDVRAQLMERGFEQGPPAHDFQAIMVWVREQGFDFSDAEVLEAIRTRPFSSS
jgi:hypothetical protein